MSRERPVETIRALAGERWAHLKQRAAELYGQFRASRLPAQVAVSAGLVAVAGLVSLLPATGPLGRVREAVTAAVTRDYDFRGQAERANAWARKQGGWNQALSNTWRSATERVRQFAKELPQLPGGTGGAADGHDVPATGTGGGTGIGGTGGAGTGGAGQGAQSGGAAATEDAQGRPRTVMPVEGEVLYGYGWLPQGRKVHEGLDLSAGIGDKVVAISDGTVVRVGTDPVLGTLVEVDHGFVVALYGQVSSVDVKAGDAVTQGQKLAVVAKPTGREGDDAPHLHLEVRLRRGGNAVDPSPFLPGGDVQGGR